MICWIQAYWGQIFLLPKKLIREVRGICRRFLWTSANEPSRKAPIAWDTLCMPKSCGGLSCRDWGKRNQAAVLKLLWALAAKKDRLWVSWIHHYYIKGRSLMMYHVNNNASTMLTRLMKLRSIVQEWGTWSRVLHKGNFSIHKAYWAMMHQLPKVPWKALV